MPGGGAAAPPRAPPPRTLRRPRQRSPSARLAARCRADGGAGSRARSRPADSAGPADGRRCSAADSRPTGPRPPVPHPSASELVRGYSERITRAGLPTATTSAGRSLTTTAPGPDHRVGADADPRTDNHPPAQPDVDANGDRPGRLPLGPMRLGRHRMSRGQHWTPGPTWTSPPILRWPHPAGPPRS